MGSLLELDIIRNSMMETKENGWIICVLREWNIEQEWMMDREEHEVVFSYVKSYPKWKP